jgi:hypothetical protein
LNNVNATHQKLRDIWMDLIKKAEDGTTVARVDALSWLSRLTLDIIDLGGNDRLFHQVGLMDIWIFS